MKVGIHQPQYLPWIPYFLKIESCDLFIILDSVDFQKNGLQNRNTVKTPQGACWLTVPVKQKLGQKILEIETIAEQNWQKKHWITLLTNYRRTPFFKSYQEELEHIFQQPWKLLVDINLALLSVFLKWLNITTPCVKSSTLKSIGKASELVLNLCLETQASTYVSGVGGQGYLVEEDFQKAGVEIVYQSPKLSAAYPQQYPNVGFLNDLSAIDMLFNCGPDWKKYLTNVSAA